VIASTAADEPGARSENRTAATAHATNRDFVNFYGLDEASLELSMAAVAEARPLTDAQLDVISSLIGFMPVDLDAVPHGQLVGGATLDAHRLDLDLVDQGLDHCPLAV
jgi:hypothetical protein